MAFQHRSIKVCSPTVTFRIMTHGYIHIEEMTNHSVMISGNCSNSSHFLGDVQKTIFAKNISQIWLLGNWEACGTIPETCRLLGILTIKLSGKQFSFIAPKSRTHVNNLQGVSGPLDVVISKLRLALGLIFVGMVLWLLIIKKLQFKTNETVLHMYGYLYFIQG
jgi:hypothetical protein